MGRIEVKIEDGGKYYFFTTKEKVVVCSKCNNNYLRRKFCLKCWKEHNIKIKTICWITMSVGILFTLRFILSENYLLALVCSIISLLAYGGIKWTG